MITPNVSSFYVIRLSGEAAEAVTSLYAPASALDIQELTVTSDDFKSDIEAANRLDDVVKQITASIEPVQVTEKFNPIFTAQPINEVDELINLDSGGGYSFTGFNGNPFVFKNVEVTQAEAPLIVGRVQYHPFDLPAYLEIAHAKEDSYLN